MGQKLGIRGLWERSASNKSTQTGNGGVGKRTTQSPMASANVTANPAKLSIQADPRPQTPDSMFMPEMKSMLPQAVEQIAKATFKPQPTPPLPPPLPVKSNHQPNIELAHIKPIPPTPIEPKQDHRGRLRWRKNDQKNRAIHHPALNASSQRKNCNYAALITATSSEQEVEINEKNRFVRPAKKHKNLPVTAPLKAITKHAIVHNVAITPQKTVQKEKTKNKLILKSNVTPATEAKVFTKIDLVREETQPSQTQASETKQNPNQPTEPSASLKLSKKEMSNQIHAQKSTDKLEMLEWDMLKYQQTFDNELKQAEVTGSDHLKQTTQTVNTNGKASTQTNDNNQTKSVKRINKSHIESSSKPPSSLHESQHNSIPKNKESSRSLKPVSLPRIPGETAPASAGPLEWKSDSLSSAPKSYTEIMEDYLSEISKPQSLSSVASTKLDTQEPIKETNAEKTIQSLLQSIELATTQLNSFCATKENDYCRDLLRTRSKSSKNIKSQEAQTVDSQLSMADDGQSTTSTRGVPTERYQTPVPTTSAILPKYQVEMVSSMIPMAMASFNKTSRTRQEAEVFNNYQKHSNYKTTPDPAKKLTVIQKAKEIMKKNQDARQRLLSAGIKVRHRNSPPLYGVPGVVPSDPYDDGGETQPNGNNNTIKQN